MVPFDKWLKQLFLLQLLVLSLSRAQVVGPFIRNLRSFREWKPHEIFGPNYNNQQAPSVDGNPVKVDVNLEILSFRAIKEGDLSVFVDVFLHLKWRDNRLRAPLGSKPGGRVILDHRWLVRLWTPTLNFKNSRNGKIIGFIRPSLYLTITNGTEVFMAAKVALETNCDMNFIKFPFDTQTCQIEISSLSNTDQLVTLSWERFNLTQNLHLPQFEVSDPTSQQCVLHYGAGTFSCLKAQFILTRNVGYFLISRYIPSVLIVCLAFAGFWIPTTSYAARVGLIITALLSLITLQQYQAPLNVSYIYALSFWMFICTVFVFSCLIEFAVAISDIPQKMTPVNSNFDAVTVAVEDDTKPGLAETLKKRYRRYKEVLLRPNSRNNIVDMYSRIAFPVAFLCCLFIYALVLLF